MLAYISMLFVGVVALPTSQDLPISKRSNWLTGTRIAEDRGYRASEVDVSWEQVAGTRSLAVRSTNVYW